MPTSRLLYKNILLLLSGVIQMAQQTKAQDSLLMYGHDKEVPREFEKPILTALSYFPELEEVHIIFRIRKAHTPLTTKPNVAGIFAPKNHRTYIVIISNETSDTLTHLLYQNLSFEEQVGIMGHELSHVVDFKSKNFVQSISSGVGHISKKYVDKMEFNTDRICIMHGLGKYLEAYSMHVRHSMHVHNWRGADFVNEKNETHERCMNPDTIEKYMDTASPPH
jgi:hypothetical protein